MADYYPLIARAIAGLDPSAPGESRRALYERARAALIAQLRGVQPPLSESEITRERLSLEEAVRKVESEAAQRARERLASRRRAAPAIPSAPRTRACRCRPSEPAPPASAQPPAPPRASAPAIAAAGAQRPSAARPGRPPAAQPRPDAAAVAAAARRSRRSRCRIRSCRRPANAARRAAPRPRQRRPPQAPGMRGFRDIAADADDLGRAAAQANRSARKTYANVPSPSPEFDRLEPSMENRGADPRRALFQ